MKLPPPPQVRWILDQHRNSNHLYDDYLPYEFHLRMTVAEFHRFKHLLPKNLYTINVEVHRNTWEDEDWTISVIEKACWGHDLIEDARVSYNDVKRVLDYKNSNYIAEIIRAVTNNVRGRDRNERMPDYIYEEIRNTPGAVFVKLCDRIANVTYSKMVGSSMFEKYGKEQKEFQEKLGRYDSHQYLEPMFAYLDNLLFH